MRVYVRAGPVTRSDTHGKELNQSKGNVWPPNSPNRGVAGTGLRYRGQTGAVSRPPSTVREGEKLGKRLLWVKDEGVTYRADENWCSLPANVVHGFAGFWATAKVVARDLYGCAYRIDRSLAPYVAPLRCKRLSSRTVPQIPCSGKSFVSSPVEDHDGRQARLVCSDLICLRYLDRVLLHSGSHVDERIEEFLRQFDTRLSAMSESELQTRVQSLIKLKQLPDVSLDEEVSRNWNEILSEEYLFDRLQQEVSLAFKGN